MATMFKHELSLYLQEIEEKAERGKLLKPL